MVLSLFTMLTAPTVVTRVTIVTLVTVLTAPTLLAKLAIPTLLYNYTSPMILAISSVDTGVVSEGLSTIVLPAASAGAHFHTAMRSG